MARQLISSGSEFESSIGYSRAVVDGNWVMVSGTTGYDYTTMMLPDGVVAQTEQCMKNIESALAEAGACLSDVVRVMYIYPDAEDFPKCWPVLSQHFGKIKPAATMISAGLLDPAMKVEIQVTALKQSS
jgi:enamine deaminase RidA (YjgF/YER057c/UK114 family)